MTNKEAIEILNDFIDVEGSAVIGMTSLREAIKIAIKAIEERPQGEWIILNGDKVCPFCRTGTSYNTNASITFFQFCPYCGADMRGGRE